MSVSLIGRRLYTSPTASATEDAPTCLHPAGPEGAETGEGPDRDQEGADRDVRRDPAAKPAPLLQTHVCDLTFARFRLSTGPGRRARARHRHPRDVAHHESSQLAQGISGDDASDGSTALAPLSTYADGTTTKGGRKPSLRPLADQEGSSTLTPATRRSVARSEAEPRDAVEPLRWSAPRPGGQSDVNGPGCPPATGGQRPTRAMAAATIEVVSIPCRA
jgi:hypothetical protein